MRMIDALSLEQPMAEEQFLARELGIRWLTVSQDELAHALRTNSRTLLIVSDPNLYEEELSKAPTRSSVVLQISDEAYTPDRLHQATLPAVRTIFRHYAPDIASPSQRMRAVAGFISDARTSDVPMRSAKPLYETGKTVRHRMASWRTVSLPVHAIPLGYTNAFATTNEEITETPMARTTSISFRGNRGLSPRILGLEAAERVSGADIQLVDQAWSGAGRDNTSARDYVDQLRNSRFALVPPGFVNAESFRYYEAVLSGALPVEIRVALTHQGLVPFRSDASVRAWSWTDAMRQIRDMSEDERLGRLEVARTLMDQQCASARASIAKAVEE